MENLNYDELLNAVVNDLRMNGADNYLNVCNYLWDNDCAPFDSNHIAWNTAEGLYEWCNDDLEDAVANNWFNEAARLITDYIVDSYYVNYEDYEMVREWHEAHPEYEWHADETAFDDMVEKCHNYIKDINKQMLLEDVQSCGITKRVFENFISACDKDFTKYDAIATKYSKKYDYDFTSKKTKEMVMAAIG